MYIEDKLKIFLNIIQYYLTNDSDKILLIFDTRWQLERYRKGKKEEQLKDEILVTYTEITYKDLPHILVGRRIRRYWFMTDRDLLEEKESNDDNK